MDGVPLDNFPSQTPNLPIRFPSTTRPFANQKIRRFPFSPAEGFNTNALIFFASHCEPEGRGNLILARDCFVASLLAMTGYLLRLY